MVRPSASELLDLVDDNDSIIGVIEREKAYAEGVKNFRAIDGFIRNSEGKLFIPRRHPDKRLFPLALDASVGGHVTSGETYDEAFTKETKEELGIDITKTPHKRLGFMNPHQDQVSAFLAIYEIQSNETPKYNPHDFVEHFWLTPQELLDKIERGEATKGNLPKIVHKFYLT